MSTFTVFLIFYLLFDVYAYFGIKSLLTDTTLVAIYTVGYVALSGFTLFCFYKIWFIARTYGMFSGTQVNFYLGMFLTAFAAKFALAFFFFLQDGPRYFIGLLRWIQSFFQEEGPTHFLPSRRKSLTTLAVGLASIPFISMLYGVTKGKYRYTINRLTLKFDNLPKSFDGFKIVQISDIHAGSLDNPDEIARGVRMINDLNPDTVLFTGDMVNSDKDELNPFLDIFNKIKSKEGNFAVLGNHDYYGLGDLREEEKKGYWEDFYEKFRYLGFDLLNNTNRTITRGQDSIKIVGVENWGAGRWFPKEGDLDKALNDVESDAFCVLMSHDPTHWEQKVLDHDKQIDLTLSGHTHGFQFGINMPGFKWSPAQYRYKRWIGLHEEKGQKLYINKGFGFLAFPGRVGMWPEITLIELQST